MLISEVIKRLEELKKEHGDIPVYCNHDTEGLFFNHFCYPGLEEYIYIDDEAI